ncbi:hypothetical protein LCGC14_2599960 [marine sediment metagenome]|uniref:Uncharacterized protein n=1 Tax=marine sediment metagenome TaxID=412755 RepID=A0A0F9AWR6_9ZZZZ
MIRHRRNAHDQYAIGWSDRWYNLMQVRVFQVHRVSQRWLGSAVCWYPSLEWEDEERVGA